MYVRMIDGWLVRKGFGSYIEAEVDNDGQLVAVRPRRTATGEIKVVKPQMVIGYLLEMASGSKDTPKGGHAGDLLARAGQEAITACGPRSKMKFKKGAYGSGTCADEPWSLQAYQKLREEHAHAHAREFLVPPLNLKKCENEGCSNEGPGRGALQGGAGAQGARA